MTDIWANTATELAAMIAAKELAASEVIEAHLARIEAVNPATGALTSVLAEQARAEAAAADSVEVSARGPLHGVPFTVKDQFDVAGSATTMGVSAFAGAVVAVDAPVVAAVRRAGAIPIAKANLPEFAVRWHTDNDLFGPTRNPWDATRSPGGSSGGDAVAVATGMTPLGLGGDYGGSLRIPAGYCGISSLRPTPGRVPLASSLPGPAPTLTVQLFTSPGPLARTVADLTLMYDAMLGDDPRDPAWIPALDVPDGALHPVAVTTSGADPEVDPDVRAAVRRAADALADAGHPVVEVEPPLIGQISDAYARLLVTEVMTLQHEGIRALGGADLITFVETLPELFSPLDLAGYAHALAERLTLRRQWSAFLAQYPIVLGPVSSRLPWPVGHDLGGAGNVRAMFTGHRLTVCANYLALPAVAVPAGLSGSGLPIGVQLITAPFTERRALAAASRVSERIGHHAPIDPRGTRA